MKIYLVGGAVRDKLLQRPVHEKDWVVVGGCAQDLLAKGYKQVGKSFPVFLHPKTQEEYALARTEKKSAPGYYGFDCDFSPTVTLEEDLLRRDLTINAIAQDEVGNIIDPYQGIRDLESRVFRHISQAFAEDPVRVLRVARFASRFHSQGFTLAAETRTLMYSMVKSGELRHLVAERVWQEWHRSLQEANPEQFILTLRACDALGVVLPEINVLFGIPNPYKYHQEVDSGIHTLLVLQAAVRLSACPKIRFAALVHDLGKANSPMSCWPTHHGHEEKGVSIINSLCDRLRIPNDYRHLALIVSRYHLNIHRLFELKASTIVKVLESTDAFRRSAVFYDLLVVCQADALGSLSDKGDYKQADLWRYILSECAKIDSQQIIAQGFKGPAIKEELSKRRVACVRLITNSWKIDEK